MASLYYAADRKYNIPKIIKLLDEGENVILDRYVYSNMAHQAGKLNNEEARLAMFKWLEKLEYDLLELPKPDISIFLYMPYEYSKELQNKRNELDGHELSKDHLINASNAYLEMSTLYNFIQIECVKNNKIRTKEDINDEIYSKIESLI